jgi:GDP-L-fucose synthase
LKDAEMTTPELSLAGRRVWVAGHRGMVGSALVRALSREDAVLQTVTHEELDLRRQSDTEAWMQRARPEFIFLAAARVGGILANDTYPARFLYDNLMIQANIVEAARLIGVEKTMLLGSSCIYPRLAPQPITEDSLLTGPLEETNQWYAVAKIAGIKLGQSYRREHGMNVLSVMPTNLYGPNDDYDLQNSHVAAALLRRIHQARVEGAPQVTIWGSGTPLREFLHVDDLARACIFLMKTCSDPDPINIGSGQEVTVFELAQLIADIVGWSGQFVFDSGKPDGTPRKLLDVGRLTGLGWTASIPMREGLIDAYNDFKARWHAGEFGSPAPAAA